MASNRAAAKATKAQLKAMQTGRKVTGKKVTVRKPAAKPAAKPVRRYHLSADHNGAYAYREM